MNNLKKDLAKRIHDYENPRRTALSKKYPRLKKPIIFLRQATRNLKNFSDFNIKHYKKSDFLSCVIARHQSVLRRKLGNSDLRLQEQKVKNLEQVVKRLNGVIIPPNKIFSLWHVVGKPKKEKGYVNGMLLSNGKVIEGLGGGLCQVSNFLYWIFLHAPIEIVERHHHSQDVFPDSGRTLPFGSGATILYNFVDLKVRNTSRSPLQLRLWLTDSHLKGQILSSHPAAQKFHVTEKNHFFIKKGKQYFRYNEIYREVKNNKTKKAKKVITNFAPVLYKVTKEYLKKNNFKVLDFTGEK